MTYYANVRPTDRSWRRDVFGPLRRSILGTAPIPQDRPVMGIQSSVQLDEILADFRDVLAEVCAAAPENRHRLGDLFDSIHERSSLQLTGQFYDSKSRRLQPRWDTTNRSFVEMLYSYVILSFYLVPVHFLRRCIACDRFFFTSSGQRAKYCTGRCQIRTAMRRFRGQKKLPPRTRSPNR